MFGMSNSPRVIRHTESAVPRMVAEHLTTVTKDNNNKNIRGVQNPTNSVVDGLRFGEGLMSALVGNYP